jgi:hypothetical protein
MDHEMGCAKGMVLMMLMFALSTVITDPDNPSFDLEKYLTKVAKDNP